MIVVAGSLNVDYVVRVSRRPAPGETVLGSDYERHFGGKGANQAVAAARLGAQVRMMGCVGFDADGTALRRALEAHDVDARSVVQVDGPSGAAFITVDASGQNSIVVAPGANARFEAALLTRGAFEGARVVVLQLEVPSATVAAAARWGREAGASVVLNAAPVREQGAYDLGHVSVLVVNEFEAGVLSGRPAPRSAAEALDVAAELRSRAPAVAVTLGEQGAVWSDGNGSFPVEPFAVAAVDTTGAGDAFVGALAASLADGSRPQQAMRFASAAGALATLKRGALEAMPRRDEVLSFLAARE